MKKYLVFIAALGLVACATGGAKKSTDPNATGKIPANTPSSSTKANDPVISVTINGETHRFGRDELLHSPLAQPLTVENDATYHKKMTYTAVPATLIFGGVDTPPNTTLVFTCADGFSAPIAAEKVLNMLPTKSMAYIAIEDPASPWPTVGKGSKKTAGPFYLVWQNPKVSKISDEEWPFQLVSFELKPEIEKQFPRLLPDAKAGLGVKKGFSLFVKNCFTCHTLNNEGTAAMGPDLNVPMNPTEYLRPGIIEKLVRNTQSVRHWPQSKMSTFSREALSDEDVKNIVLYLKHMSMRKKPTS